MSTDQKAPGRAVVPPGASPSRNTLSPARRRSRRAGSLVGMGFVAPAMLFFVAFLLVPIAYAIFLSFRGLRVDGAGGAFGRRVEGFVGFANYAAALTDAEFVAGVDLVKGYFSFRAGVREPQCGARGELQQGT